MPSMRRLIIALVVTLVAGLIILFPARVAYRAFAPPDIVLTPVNGTLWSGGSDRGSVAGVYFTDLRWRIRPQSIFKARIAYKVEAALPGGFVNADVAVTAGGDILISNAKLSLALATVADVTGMRGLAGKANADIGRIRLRDGMPVEAEGFVEVRNLTAPHLAPGSLGGYRTDLATDAEGIVATVEDTDGVVDIDGRLILGVNRQYQFLGQLAAKPETPQGLRDQMRFLGSPDANGQYPLRLEGSL